MRRPQHSKKVNDSPSGTGGLSLWLGMAAAAMLIAGIMHPGRPAAPVKTPGPATPSNSTAPVSRATRALECPRRNDSQETFFADPQANRYAALAGDFENETDPLKREELIAAWLADVKMDEAPAMLTFLQSAEPAELAQDLGRRLIRQWTADSPEKAVAWIETLPPEKRMTLLDEVAVVWAGNQPTNAMTWAKSFSDETTRNQTLAAVAGEVVRSEPVMALQAAIDLPVGPQRDDLICRGAKQWASEDAEGAAAWAKQITQGDLRNQALSGIAIVWSAGDPVSAATLALKELPAGRLLDDTVVSLVQRWAQQQPEMAAAWVELFPEGELREAAVENLLVQWSQTDAEGADRWRAAHL